MGNPRLCNTPKREMDEYEKIIVQSKKNKCVKEQIIIVHLGLGFEEAHHPWSRDIYQYSSIEIIGHVVKFCLPLTKKKNLPKGATPEHPLLPQFPTLGMLAGDVDDYYSETAKNDNQLRLKALGELEKEELMGKWDGAEYMNEMNWPEKNEERIQN